MPLSKSSCHSLGLASSTQGSKAIKPIFEELINTKKLKIEMLFLSLC